MTYIAREIRSKQAKSIIFAGGLLAASLASSAAFATPVVGTDSIGYNSVAVSGNGANLVGATSIFSTTGNGRTQSVGGSALAVIPISTAVTLNTLFPKGVNGGNGGSEPAFSFTITSYGTFVEVGTPLLEASTSTGQSEGAEYYLLGTFTPTALLGGTAGAASFDVSYTETVGTSSNSYSGSGTFSTPPTQPSVAVAEPGSMAVLGSGLLGLGLLTRWKMRAGLARGRAV